MLAYLWTPSHIPKIVITPPAEEAYTPRRPREPTLDRRYLVPGEWNLPRRSRSSSSPGSPPSRSPTRRSRSSQLSALLASPKDPYAAYVPPASESSLTLLLTAIIVLLRPDGDTSLAHLGLPLPSSCPKQRKFRPAPLLVFILLLTSALALSAALHTSLPSSLAESDWHGGRIGSARDVGVFLPVAEIQRAAKEFWPANVHIWDY